MAGLLKIIKRVLTLQTGKEPTLIIGVFATFFTMIITFGVPLSQEQLNTTMAFIVAIMALLIRLMVYAPDTVDKLLEQTAENVAREVRKDVIINELIHPDIAEQLVDKTNVGS